MYLSPSATDTDPLRKWKAKKNAMVLGLPRTHLDEWYDLNRYSSASSGHSAFSSPQPRKSSPSASSFSYDYNVKLAESRSLPTGYHATSPRPWAAATVGRQMDKEVDYLTDLMVNGMRQSVLDPRILGMCYKCGQKVVGQGNGCMALNQMYHVQCFTCSVCRGSLRYGTFYLVDNQPYCETDYYNSLSDCCVCHQKIQDKIIHANNRTYHSTCFTCSSCGTCLDGVSFTLDQLQQNHCIPCFQQKYAPKCCKCGLAISPRAGEVETVRIMALNKSFHTRCYKCDDCQAPLYRDGDLRSCYPHSGAVLCDGCYQRRIQ